MCLKHGYSYVVANATVVAESGTAHGKRASSSIPGAMASYLSLKAGPQLSKNVLQNIVSGMLIDGVINFNGLEDSNMR